MAAQIIKLPELGEGIASGIVASLSVAPGATLKENDPLFEIETDKAVLPVPSPVSGTCIRMLIKVGEEIKIGQPVAEVDTSAAPSAPAPAAVAAPAPAAKAESVKTESVKTEPAKPAPAPVSPVAVPAPAKVEAPAAPAKAPAASVAAVHSAMLAGPATRKYARELGIDLAQVRGSKRGGRIDIDDIKAYVKSLNLKDMAQMGQVHVPASAPAAALPLPDFSRFGQTRREPMTQLRKVISERMSRNWSTIPHVFQCVEIDLTLLKTFQDNCGEDFKARGSSASPTNFFIKALALCLKEFPTFNSSLDAARQEIVYKDYFNIGVAVDTPSGLIVPVLKNVDRKSIFEIGKELKELAQKTRERKILPDDLQGSCITLSNLGGFGGTHFTPIINGPDVAILGVGRSEVKAKYLHGGFVPRTVVNATLSYDHRVIDGAEAARFVARLATIMENFDRVLLGG